MCRSGSSEESVSIDAGYSCVPHKLPVFRPNRKKPQRLTAIPRPSPSARGYGRRWRKIRAAKLARDPLCEDHEALGEVVEATEVDHVDGDVGNVAYCNLRSLCKSCHSSKTVRENGGLGNKQARA
jgi:5-methylcytosine-specific restriction enzyme A